MREFKFRAWDKENSEMKYNAEQAYKGHWQMNDIMYFGQLLDNPKYELMQYVEMKDRNGNGIYEGDIVTVLQTDDEDFVRTHEIKMINGSWCFQRLYGDYHIAKLGDLFSFGRQNFGITVIGNIYENPELDKSR